MFVGCEDNPELTVNDILAMHTEWTKGSGEDRVDISFVRNTEPETFHLDVMLAMATEQQERYYIPVADYAKSKINGTYTVDDDDYEITITLSFSDPELTVSFSGQGPLDGRSFAVEPAP